MKRDDREEPDAPTRPTLRVEAPLEADPHERPTIPAPPSTPPSGVYVDNDAVTRWAGRDRGVVIGRIRPRAKRLSQSRR